MPAVQNMSLRAIAPGEEGALARLFQLYCYDNAGWSGEDVLADGRYDACDAGLAEYVHAPGHTAHWIEVDGALAGFYVTEPGMAGTLPVQEFSDFFILRKYGAGGWRWKWCAACCWTARRRGWWRRSAPMRRPARSGVTRLRACRLPVSRRTTIRPCRSFS